MKISLEWLQDFVDLEGLTPQEIALRLTMATAEVEGLIEVKRAIHGIRVAEVLEVEGTKRIKRVKVDCGDVRYETACGAPNVRVGMKAPFAPVGVTLAGDMLIKEVKIAGVISQGVLCSPKELGMSSWHEGLLECPADIPKGTPLGNYIPPRDVLIEVDNKSITHRPDLWGHYGFARELAALFNRPLRPLAVMDLAAYHNLPEIPLEIEDSQDCPAYGCLGFEMVSSSPSSLVIQRRLHAIGQRTFNLIVDVSNYVMFEIGQPNHTFDGDKISSIRVARMGKKAAFVPIDGQERIMLPDDVMIWDQEKPVAIAGVMGGSNSEVTPTTRRIILECANFKGARIRRTAVRLGLRTEASQRFEKDLPPAQVRLGAGRYLQLIQDSGQLFKILTRFNVAYPTESAVRAVSMPSDFISRRAGTSLPQPEIERILNSLGFSAVLEGKTLRVGIPAYRSAKDISIPEDILEEVLRIYGYDNIPPQPLQAALAPVPRDIPVFAEHKARRILAAGHGFMEMHTYSWTDEYWLKRLNCGSARALEVKNPSASQNRYLRTHLLPNLFQLVDKNHMHRDAFRLFELGKIYSAGEDSASLESLSLAGVAYQQAKHAADGFQLFLEIKKALEDVSVIVGGEPLVFQKGEEAGAPWETPGLYVHILQSGKRLGSAGMLSPDWKDAVSPLGQVAWFALDFDAWKKSAYRSVDYAALAKYPGSWQDFSLLYDSALGYVELNKLLHEFQHPFLDRFDFLYPYRGKELPAGKTSYSFRFWLKADDRTITLEDIGEFRNAFLSFLASQQLALR